MPVKIRRAVAQDTSAVTDCVCQAFIHYIPRIGKQPGPMLDNYQLLIDQSVVYAAYASTGIVGVLVLTETDEGFCLETIATHPRIQGQGIGGRLLSFAEDQARQAGHTSIYLSTHKLMHESQAIYRHLGYVEFDRRIVNGYDRIFVRKQL